MSTNPAVNGLVDAAGHLSATDLHSLIGRLQHLEAASYDLDDLGVMENLANKNALA